MASLILLVAMIGAIVLTLYKRRNASKKQFIFQQVARNFGDSIGYAALNEGGEEPRGSLPRRKE